MLQDLRFALRLMRKDVWFTAAAVVALALGLGANSTVFTIANAVLFRGLPFPESDRIVTVMGASTADAGRRITLSHPDWHDWRSQSRSFDGLAAYRNGAVNVSDPGRTPVRTAAVWLSADAFPLLRTQPALGRTFRPEDTSPGAEPVAIIGHRLWQNRYGADPAMLGRTIVINERPVTVVGVMPDDVEFPTNTELWQPLVPAPADANRGMRSLVAFGRLRAGVTLVQARTELSAIARESARKYPDSNRELDAAALRAVGDLGQEIRLVMLALMGAVGFVLLIACANVANLLLSRSAFRAREMALRAALGATRRRLLRQLLIESLLMAAIAGAIGVLIAMGGVRLFDRAVADTGKPYWLVFTMDWRVVAYVATVCLATAIAFGLAPALQASSVGLESVLRDGGRAQAGGRRSHRLTSVLVTAQVALTLTLLTAAGLMGRSLLHWLQLDVGVDASRVVTMGVGLAETKYGTPEARRLFHDRLLARLEREAGIAAVSVATAVPGTPGPQRRVQSEAAPDLEWDRVPQARVIGIGDRYFDVLGVTLRAGRAFALRDGTSGSEAAIVSERFAARFLAGRPPVGQRIRLLNDRETGSRGPWLTIVGVSPTILQGDLQASEPEPVVYLPYRQDPVAVYTAIVRPMAGTSAETSLAGSAIGGDTGGLARAIPRAVLDVDPNQPIDRMRTLSAGLSQQYWPNRVFGGLFTIFAVIALVLSAVGLYAVSAYAVSRRRQEIGVRMALGAAPGQIVWQVLRTGLVQLALGVAIGMTGAWAVGRVLGSLLFRTSALDPLTLVGIPLLLLAVTVVACWAPARRAARIDPVAALRAD